MMKTWTGHLVDIMEKRNAYRGLWLRNMKEITQKNQDDNIKMDLKEMGWVGMEWIHLTQNRGKWWALVNTVMNVQVS